MIFRKLNSNRLLVAFAKLTTGSAISQLIGIISMLVLSRLYIVEAFGIQALFNSIGGIIAIFIAGKYDLAIVLPKKDEDGIGLVYIVAIISLFGCVFLYGFIDLFGESLFRYFGWQIINDWGRYLPLVVFLSTVYDAMYNFMNRCKKYRLMIISGIVVSVVNFAVGVGYACVYPGDSFGLLYATFMGKLVAGIYLLCLFVRERWLFVIAVGRLKYLAIKYANFPKYLTFGEIVGYASSQLPIFILNKYTNSEVVGLFSMTNKLLGIPLRFIGSSVQNVYFKEANDEFRLKGNCCYVFLYSIKILLFISVLLLIGILGAAPMIISFFLGTEWSLVGVYSRYLCIGFILQLVYSPVACTSSIFSKQRLDMLFQCFRFVSLMLIMLVSYWFFATDDSLIISYGIGMAFVYSIGVYFCYVWSKGKNKFGSI